MSQGWGEDQVAFFGDYGDHITELQRRLQETGYNVEVTGTFDQQTQDALDTFGGSQSVAAGDNKQAIIALQSATGALEDSKWEQQLIARPPTTEYDHTASLRPKYVGEEQPGNTVWAGQNRDQTYYPDDATASGEYGVAVEGGRVTIPGEVDANGNPVYLDTTDATGGVGLIGNKPERMTYTMGEDGELRLADARTEQDLQPGKRFHHSSLAGGGGEVAGAGEMKVREGTVEAVSDRSGHYQPDLAMTQQVGQRLAEGGVDTSRVTFELGNYSDDLKQEKPDTLVSGTELEAYDIASTRAQLQRECAAKADALGQRKWGNAWSLLEVQNPQLKQEEFTKFYNELWAPIEQMDERALYGEARRMLEERHDQKRALLAEIAGAKGWREDPLGRHPWRWYDGAQWTARVHGQRPDGTEGEFIDEESADIFADDEVVRQGLAAQREATERAAREEQQAAQQTVTGGYSDT